MKKVFLFVYYLLKGLYKSSFGRFILILLIVGGIYGISSIFSEPEPEESRQKHYNYVHAYTNAEVFVKKQLKAPSTAKFPSSTEYRDHVTRLGNDRFEINSWVDAQNSFGAMIRNDFSCEIKFKGDSVFCSNLLIE